MEPFWRACLAANRAVARTLSEGLSAAQRHKSTVGAGGDISSGIDLEAEAIFVEHLRPFGRIDSEESGSIGTGEYTVLLDPIDGSSNILSGFPYYGTSAALVDPAGTTVSACVCNLAAGEIFFKTPGAPAQHGDIWGEDWAVYDPQMSPEIGIFERAYAYPDIVAVLGEAGMKFRAPGAAALSLVYALETQFFLFEGAYRTFDVAAGLACWETGDVRRTSTRLLAARDPQMLRRLDGLLP